jgi:16S rRNA (guanine(1405)-N(7))-methyltransferase
MHASTQEREAIPATFFYETLADLGHLESVLDLASGLNPLNIASMPVASGCTYWAVDVYADMVDYLNLFFSHFELKGKASLCDLTQNIPGQEVQVAFLIKTIPCLEQIDKNAGQRLLEGIKAPNILVSFPSRSLGGRPKGMIQNYEAHFNQLIAGKGWQVTRFEFPGELAFLVRK